MSPPMNGNGAGWVSPPGRSARRAGPPSAGAASTRTRSTGAGGVEVGYFFAPAAWGKGYATELTRFCLEIARRRFRLPLVTAFAHPDNAGSRRVLEKAGFVEERYVDAMDRILYRCRLAPA